MEFKRLWVERVVIALGATALFFGYAWLPLQTSGLWNAPDEVAAAYMAERLPVLGGAYQNPARLADELGAMVHPRSLTVVGGNLVPGMWLGLPWLLSFVHALTGLPADALELLIPLVAVLAVLAWTQIVSKLFQDRRVGWASGLALAMFPGWWYYTARGLHPNVLFVSLGILAAWFWYVLTPTLQEKGSWRLALASQYGAGSLLGLMIFTRVHELIWIAPVILVAFLARRRRVREWVPCLLGLVTVALVAMSIHASVYGSAFANGYQPNVDPLPITIVHETDPVIANSAVVRVARVVFPFGVREMNILRNAFTYQVVFFPLWSALFIFGCIILLGRYRSLSAPVKSGLKRVTLVALPVSVYLLALYGSWNFNDNPDPTAVTIGTSYIRYWLPVTLLMTPLIGYVVARGLPESRPEWYRRLAAAVFVAALVFTGTHQTFTAPEEGLYFVHDRLEEYAAERAFVLGETKETDVIIVERSDKILFPYRDVVVPLRSERTYQMLPFLEQAVRDQGGELLYWDLALTKEDQTFLEETRLDPYDLQISERALWRDHVLYVIEKQ